MEAKSLALAYPMALLDDIAVAWEAIGPAGPDRAVTCASLQAAYQVAAAFGDRDDREIELMARLGRVAEAWRFVGGRPDLTKRLQGLHAIYAAMRDSGRTDDALLEEMEAAARKNPDRSGTAAALARLGALLRSRDDERSRALLDESLQLATALENPERQIDVVEYLAPALRAVGDPRADAVLERVELSARRIAVARERAMALGRLGMILADFGSGARADSLLNEAQQLSLRLLKEEGDAALGGDMALYGIRLPGDRPSEPTELDKLIREASALTSAGNSRAAEVLRAAEDGIRGIPDPFLRQMEQMGLANSLAAAGAIDAALDVASRIADAQFRRSALLRIVQAMVVNGDGRAEDLFRQIESMGTAPPVKERCDALGAVAIALYSAKPVLAAEILGLLFKRAESADESTSGPEILLSLAKTLARMKDRRCEELFNRVLQRAMATSGLEVVLGQMVLRELVEALLECGFVDQAKAVIKQIRLNDQLMFAMKALAGGLATRGDFETADKLVPLIEYQDLGEAARIRVLAARALANDPQALAYFDEWPERVSDLRRRFVAERALGALAHALLELGRLREAREVTDSMTYQEGRAEALVQLAGAFAKAAHYSDALRVLPPIGVDRYVCFVAELARLLDVSDAGKGVAALREVTRIVGWVRADWKAVHAALAKTSIGADGATR
jgi:hypothetical protein